MATVLCLSAAFRVTLTLPFAAVESTSFTSSFPSEEPYRHLVIIKCIRIIHPSFGRRETIALCPKEHCLNLEVIVIFGITVSDFLICCVTVCHLIVAFLAVDA